MAMRGFSGDGEIGLKKMLTRELSHGAAAGVNWLVPGLGGRRDFSRPILMELAVQLVNFCLGFV
jgi:hypothetical protein